MGHPANPPARVVGMVGGLARLKACPFKASLLVAARSSAVPHIFVARNRSGEPLRHPKAKSPSGSGSRCTRDPAAHAFGASG